MRIASKSEFALAKSKGLERYKVLLRFLRLNRGRPRPQRPDRQSIFWKPAPVYFSPLYREHLERAINFKKNQISGCPVLVAVFLLRQSGAFPYLIGCRGEGLSRPRLDQFHI